MVKVYHVPECLLDISNTLIQTEQIKIFASLMFSKFQAVASVNTDILAEAYNLTNHIGYDWTTNGRVNVLVDSNTVRSTSISDVLEMDGRFYVVAALGFAEITPIMVGNV